MEIVHSDITKLQIEAIVNAANTQLKHGGGVAKAIVEAGGEVIQKESDKLKFCPIGSACLTSAGNLKAKYVIHVPTIDYTNGQKATLEDIYTGAKAALEIANGLGLKSVAFPLLGAGVVGLPEKEIQKQIEKASQDYSSVEVTLCLK